MTPKLVSLVIPVYNEQDNLPELVRRSLAVGRQLSCAFEVVLVNDGSRDDSAKLIEAAAARGDVVVTLDADLQNPPEEIPKLIAGIEDGCDVVSGVRRFRKDTLFRRLASRL